MSGLFYMKLAAQNIRKNAQTYVPYILTCIGAVMMFDILLSLVDNKEMTKMHGGGEIQYIMFLGCFIIAIFTALFLFYTNSFLIRRRKMEIGLYNILGMGKKHIGIILFFETLYIAVLSLTVGILGGFLLSKGVYLILLRMAGEAVQWGFYFSVKAAAYSVVLYGSVFLLILAVNLTRVHVSSPIELLKGGQTGEKEPKTKWVTAMLGFLFLAAGYYLAIAIENPIMAINAFFIAVICVIIGTYCLFTAGSIALLKFLKKRKTFYYKTAHFISVSGMLYRMKQNAAGLAGICILSTSVLVMLSSTAALYAGMENVISNRFPRSIMFRAEAVPAGGEKEMEQVVKEVLSQEGLSEMNGLKYRELGFTAMDDGSGQYSVERAEKITVRDGFYFMYFLLQEDYNRIAGKQVQLAADECMVITEKPYENSTLTILGKTYQAVPSDERSLWEGADVLGSSMGVYVIVPNLEEMQLLDASYGQMLGEASSQIDYYYGFDLDAEEETQSRMYSEISRRMAGMPFTVSGECAADEKGAYFSLNAGLLFLGIFLGTLFVMATVLIIYYKQVTEGYDDKGRYEIMQKVGLSRREIRASIRSQLLTMFFLPLAASAVHITVAFPMIAKLLSVMNLTNVPLFAATTVGTFTAFAAAYCAVYMLTSRVYFKIVS